jgi:hypothetical protein
MGPDRLAAFAFGRLVYLTRRPEFGPSPALGFGGGAAKGRGPLVFAHIGVLRAAEPDVEGVFDTAWLVPLQLSNHPPVGHSKKNVENVLVRTPLKLIVIRAYPPHTGGLFPVRLRIDNTVQHNVDRVTLFLA